jgi:hypothetical protein
MSEVLLSHWWRSASARAAFERVEAQKRERIEKLKEAKRAKQAELARDVEAWEEAK